MRTAATAAVVVVVVVAVIHVTSSCKVLTGLVAGDVPKTGFARARALSLPLYPALPQQCNERDLTHVEALLSPFSCE